MGQYSLAYLTAATHGLDDEAARLKAELQSRDQPVPEVDPSARPILPPQPIQRCEDNWPLLSSAAGPFDAQILAAGARGTSTNQSVRAARAAAKFVAAAPDEAEDEEPAGDAWGVDGDLLLDEDGNPEDDGIQQPGAEDEEGGWEVSFILIKKTGFVLVFFAGLPE